MKSLHSIFVFLFLLSIYHISSAQTECWGWMIGSTGFEKNDAMAIDNDGNIWIAGAYDTMVDFDPDTGTTFLVSQLAPGYFIASYDIDGALRFAHSMPGLQVFDMETDTSGNVFVTGYHLTQVDADPGPGEFLLPVFGSTDICLLSYDKNGNFRWGKGIGGPAGDEGSSLSIEHSGNVILGGTFSLTVDWGGDTTNSVGGADAFVANFSNSGTLNWVTSFGSSNFESGVRVSASLSSSNIWAGTSFKDTITVPTDSSLTTHVSKGEEDIMLVYIDGVGNINLTTPMGGKNRDILKELAVDSSNNVIVAGTFKDTLPTDPSISPSQLVSKGDADVFLISYTPTGLFNTAHSIGGPDFDEATGLDLSLKGTVKRSLFLSGNFSNSIDLGQDASNNTITLNSNNFSDSYLAWFDPSDLTIQGFKQYGETEASVGLDVKVIRDPHPVLSVIISGRSSGKVNLPPYPGKAQCGSDTSYTSLGIFDIFAAKILIPTDTTTNIDKANLPYTIKIFPNPVKNLLEIQPIDDIGLSSQVSLEVFNIEGKNLISQQISLEENNRVSVRDLPQGIYLLRIFDSKGRALSSKFVKE